MSFSFDLSKRTRKRNTIHKSGKYSLCPVKRLRSHDPDMIVSVGSGDDKQEFECYKLILCYASEYFDVMLSHKMKETNTSRIEFPDKDPAEWKEFYKFIDPDTIATAKVTHDNALMLVPWFQEFQKFKLLKQCDEMIGQKEFLELYTNNPSFSDVRFWMDHTIRSAESKIPLAKKIIELFMFHDQYNLEKSKSSVLIVIAKIMCYGVELLAINKDLMKTLLNIYTNSSELQNIILGNSSSLLTNNDDDGVEHDFYARITKDGIDWDNKYFERMVEAKIENLILKMELKATKTKLGRIRSRESLRSSHLYH